MTRRLKTVTHRGRALAGAWLLALLSLAPAAQADGSLLIVGGALRDDNASVHRGLIGEMPPEGPLVIIPVASGRPAKSAAGFAASLMSHGLQKDRIRVFPLAVRDDRDTPDVDESTWSKNAWNEALLETIEDAAGFWFTGGDQMRITQAMLDPEGRESPLLKRVRERLKEGAVVGGSSAGAAIMSRDMIAGGVSFTALLEPPTDTYGDSEDQDSGRLFITRGLGFLPQGVVDQHFDRKARLGRLVRALAATGQVRGVGIDEDTALLVRPGEDQARVLGSGTVTVLDTSHARFGHSKTELAGKLSLSILAPGVRFRWSDPSVLEGQGDPTVGKEYFGYPPIQGGGMALSNPGLDQALGYDLLDNDSNSVLERLSIDRQGRVLIYRFSQVGKSAGYWRSEGADDRYTILNVQFDIFTTSAQLQPY